MLAHPRCRPPPPPQRGILEKYGVELIGAKLASINKAEDRELFAKVCWVAWARAGGSGSGRALVSGQRGGRIWVPRHRHARRRPSHLPNPPPALLCARPWTS